MLDTVTTPRTALRAAIVKRDAAAQAEVDATKAVVRAKQLLDDAEQNVALLAGVDDRIAKHRADEIKAWATNGGEKPTGELPWHLESVKSFKAESETKLTEARKTYELLGKELVAASGRVRDANAAVSIAAGAVLGAEAEPIIDQLREARRWVWSLEDKLRSLGAVLNKLRRAEAGRSNGLAHLTLPVISFAAALDEKAPPMLASNVSTPYAIALAKWEAYLQALTTQDPNSTLDLVEGSSVGSTPDLRMVRGARSW
jgi:hypothetical protein